MRTFKRFLMCMILAITIGIYPMESVTQSASDSNAFCSALPLVVVQLSKPLPEGTADPKVLKEPQDVTLFIYDTESADKGYCLSANQPGTSPLKASLHLRGSSTLTAAKHQYKVKLKEDSSSPFFKKGGKPWIFSADSATLDGSFVRSPLAFYLQVELGKLTNSLNKPWAPATQYFELFIQKPDTPLNIAADYAGLYTLAESITLKRINHEPRNAPVILYKIDQVSPEDLTVEDESGSKFIVDAFENILTGLPWVSEEAQSTKPALPTLWTKALQTWIGMVTRGNGINQTASGYQYLTDADSFAVMFLVNELAKNPDGYNKSTYLYQIRDPENRFTLYAGPLWDLNLAFGLDLPISEGTNRNHSQYIYPLTGTYTGLPQYLSADGWTFSNNAPFGKSLFWSAAFKTADVRKQICALWFLSRQKNILTTEGINQFIDKQTQLLTKVSMNADGSTSSSVSRDCKKAGYEEAGCLKEFQYKILALKAFIAARLQFMAEKLGTNQQICEQNLLYL